MVDHPGPVSWSDQARREIDTIFARYPDTKSATLPVIWLAVKEFGWISPQVEAIIADVLHRPMNEIHSVVTFYTMFPQSPLGRHHIQICRNIACWLAKAPELLEHLTARLGIRPGEVTPDQRFSLEEVECLAYCECAPALRIDGRYEGNLTREKIDQIIDEAR
jgi:NADH-quinone oxidoreductase subunit E